MPSAHEERIRGGVLTVVRDEHAGYVCWLVRPDGSTRLVATGVTRRECMNAGRAAPSSAGPSGTDRGTPAGEPSGTALQAWQTEFMSTFAARHGGRTVSTLEQFREEYGAEYPHVITWVSEMRPEPRSEPLSVREFQEANGLVMQGGAQEMLEEIVAGTPSVGLVANPEAVPSASPRDSQGEPREERGASLEATVQLIDGLRLEFRRHPVPEGNGGLAEGYAEAVARMHSFLSSFREAWGIPVSVPLVGGIDWSSFRLGPAPVRMMSHFDRMGQLDNQPISLSDQITGTAAVMAEIDEARRTAGLDMVMSNPVEECTRWNASHPAGTRVKTSREGRNFYGITQDVPARVRDGDMASVLVTWEYGVAGWARLSGLHPLDLTLAEDAVFDWNSRHPVGTSLSFSDEMPFGPDEVGYGTSSGPAYVGVGGRALVMAVVAGTTASSLIELSDITGTSVHERIPMAAHALNAGVSVSDEEEYDEIPENEIPDLD